MQRFPSCLQRQSNEFMSTGPDNAGSQAADGKAAFLDHLEQRLAAIEENWGTLRGGRWDPERLLALYARIRELGNAAGNFGLGQLGEALFSAEVYLSSFVESAAQPSLRQEEEIDGLVRGVHAAAADLAPTATDLALKPAQAQVIYLFGSRTGPWPQLIAALEAQPCETCNFARPRDLLGALAERLPQAIVADASQLDQLAPLTAELVRLHSQLAIQIPLVFISDSTDLQVRVEAMRAGGTAYFVAPFDAAAVADQILRLADPKQYEPYRVMVVEDDPTQMEFAAAILRRAGMVVMGVTEPLRVMDSLEDFRPDLILMDIYMPDINGMELTSIIRDHNEFVVTPIVFLSGEQNADKQLDALTVGGDDFIAKPIRPKHLLDVVKHRIMRSRNLQRVTHLDRKQDRVTGLFSRRHFLDRVATALESGSAHKAPGAVLYLLPDQADRVSAQQGLGAADTLLAVLGERVRAVLEPQDLACRMDDHGIAVLAHRASSEGLQALAERLRATIADPPFDLGGAAVQVTASIGLCPIDATSDDAAGLAARAERACHQVHEAGGNDAQWFKAEPAAPAKPAQGDPIAELLRDALAHDGLVLHYQPLLDLQARGTESYELLLRLPLPNGDLLGERDLRGPGATAGLLRDMDRWLAGRALQLLKERREAGRESNLFIRQSIATATGPEHAGWLAQQLRACHMVGTGLVLDYRLSDLSSDLKAVAHNLAALRELGADVCISHFPEKPAAFKVLRFLKAGYIAVAPRLLKADQATIASVVRQAHELQAKVIVANIDDPRSVDLHWSSGADFLQGNFIQRPLDHMDYDFYQIVV